jgi:hypothetical protein
MYKICVRYPGNMGSQLADRCWRQIFHNQHILLNAINVSFVSYIRYSLLIPTSSHDQRMSRETCLSFSSKH